MREGSPSDILQGAVRAPSGPKPIGGMPELRLEQRLQKCLDRALDDAILDRGNARGRNCTGLPPLGMSLRRAGLGRYAPERNSA